MQIDKCPVGDRIDKQIQTKTRTSLYWNLSLRIPYEIFRFGTSIFVARILDPRDFGIVSIATMAIFYSNTITNFGFNQAIVQRDHITQQHINSVFTVDLCLSLFLVGLFYFLAPLIAVFFNSPESQYVLQIMSVLFVLTTLYDLPHALLRRDLDFKVIAVVDACKEISMSSLTLVLAIYGFGYWSLVWGQLLPLSLASLYLILRTGWVPRLLFDRSALKDLVNFGVWSFVRAQVYFLANRIDRVIIGRYFNPSILGLYEKAKSLSQMPTESIAANINTVFFSSFSRAQHSDSELKNMLIKGLLLTSALNFPLYFGLGALAEHFVIALLGWKWAGMIAALQILCIGGVFTSFNGLVSTFIIGTGNYSKYTTRLGMLTLLLFVLCLFFIQWGITAVAAATVVYAICSCWMGFVLVRERIHFTIKELSFCLFPAGSSSIFMYIIVKMAALSYFNEINLMNLPLLVVLGACAYSFCMLAFSLNKNYSALISLKQIHI